MTTKKSKFIILIMISVLGALLLALNLTSGADDIKVNAQIELEKYLNYAVSEDDKGTLVQYHLEMGMEYLGDYDEFPVKESEISVNLNQIDGKYPYDVKVIEKGTQATNGKGIDAIENYEYDANSGILVVKANNQNEEGEKIYNDAPNSDARDRYSIICYYDTYTAENTERELSCIVSAKAILFDDDREIDNTQDFTTNATENTAELTSIYTNTQEIYNGKIKSNIINNTEYGTEYIELNQIMISKKEAQQKLQVVQENGFVKVDENNGEENLVNGGNLVIKNTKVSKVNMEKILGSDGTIEILDTDGNSIIVINKDSKWEEDGTLTINYENVLESIVVKTSEIKAEGILYLQYTKEIKNTMKDIENTKIKTITKMIGINETKVVEELEKDGEVTQEEKTEENVVFEHIDEKVITIKDSQTDVNLSVNNTNWTNKQQNEVVFDIALNSNHIKYNMFKNPTLRIDLPSEVEKVILGSSSIIYGNGLELQDPYVETNANGSLSIVANIVGTQTSYNENSLGLTTEVQIPATIILKKDIESVKSNVNLVYTNQYTLNNQVETGNKVVDIQIESYEENKQEETQKAVYNLATNTEQNETEQEIVENIDKLKTEVLVVKGDSELSDEDTVYEGEYIKFNIKVTNTAEEAIDNVKVVGVIPEGTTYGELEADYNNYMGKYAYNFDETVKSKDIQIGTLKAGETYNTFYEIRVNDLQEGETEKNISTNVKTYVGQTEASNYELTNIVKEAEAKVFLGAFMDNTSDRWNYSLKVESEEDKEVTVKIALPETYELDLRVQAGGLGDNEVVYLQADENNVVTDTIQTNKEYWYEGTVDDEAIRNSNDEGPVTIVATATAEIDGKIYNSNENRIEYEFQSVSVTMTSENEGEEVEYEEEINYEIVVKSTGKTNLNEEEDIIAFDVIDYLPEEVDPVSLEYEYWEQTEEGWVKQSETLDIGTEATDKDGNRLPNVELTLNIPFGESVVIKVKTTAEYVFEKTKIENSATVIGDTINTKTSNVVTHTILPVSNQEIEEPDEGPNNPEQPDGPDKPIDPSDPSDEKYSIEGLAWLDQNKDGQRQATEGKLSDIEIMLFDTEKSKIISSDIKTNSDGQYTISDLETGKYIVLFKYNTEKYRLTDYKKVSISSSVNSDANKKNVTLDGNKLTVGATDIIDLDASISNIDIGLIENEICDLKLDKYVSAISVTTSSGTKQYSYNNEKLAKIEIKAKEIQGATVVIEYKIVIKNEGELPASVDRIIDYIPNGMTFSSELNKNWGTQTNGQLVNTSTANQTIKPGESIEVKLVLTKSMNSNSTGTFTNIAEIGGIRNSLDISDIDSIPANKVQGEDDYSQADVIIAISTGGIVFAGITIIMVVILIIIFNILSKKGLLKIKNVSKISKISIFVLIFSALIFTGKDIVWSGNTEYKLIDSVEEKNFKWLSNSSHKNDYGSVCFEGTDDEAWEAHCINAGAGVHNGEYSFERAVSLVNMGSRTSSSPRVNISIDNENGVNIKELTISNQVYWVYGPLKVTVDARNTGKDNNDISYIAEAWDPMGDKKTVTICNEDGNNKTLSGEGKQTFYIKVLKSEVDPKQGHYGLDEIKLTAKADGVKETIKKKKGYLIYKPEAENCQWIKTTERHAVYEYEENQSVDVEDDVTWTNINVWIQVTKIDEENPNIKMPNVEFYVKRGAGKYLRLTDDNGNFRTGLQGGVTVGGYDNIKWVDEIANATVFKTNANGNIVIKNLKGGISYYLIEKNNPNAGYSNNIIGDKVNANGAYVINKNQPGQKGQIYDETLKNEKEKGNLQIIKQDADSAKRLKDVSFKVKTSDNKYIIATGGNGSWIFSTTTPNESQATTFTTDGNGTIKINEMTPGSYTVEEVSVGSSNNLYELDDNYISWQSNTGSGSRRTATVNVTSQSSATSYVIVTYKNKKKYVNLSGYVWEDKIPQAKGGKRDNLKGIPDVPIGGIEVKLMSSGGVVRTTTTDKDGKYTFSKIAIDKLTEYYIDFTYNGMAYQAVPANKDSDNGSKATEYSSRAYMHMKYSEISKDKASGTRYGPNGTENIETEIKYTYDQAEHKSTLDYECTDSSTYGLTENAPVNNVASKYIMIASTRYAYGNFYMTHDPGELDKIMTPENVRKYDISEVGNINLGLYRRDQPDIAVKKDIHSAKVQINGQTHIYNYADRFNNTDTYGDGFDTAVKFGNKYGNMSYTRAVYASDINYTGDKQLAVNVTYRISISNQTKCNTEDLSVIVNELADYYDSKYEYIAVGTSINEDGSIKDKIATTNISEELAVEGNSLYKKRLINLADKKIASGTNLDIYVEMKVIPEEIIKLVDSSEGNKEVKLDNIAEITSYSTQTANGSQYAGIDIDSNPGTTVPGDRTTYEDDTDSAPGLKLLLQEDRTISGKVFLDESNKIQVKQGDITGDIRQGMDS